jgi:hypothetical protein
MKIRVSGVICFLCLFSTRSPAQPLPNHPSSDALEIVPAVELVFPTHLGYKYQLSQSSNLTTWQAVDNETTGTGEPNRRFKSAAPTRMFYRLDFRSTIPLPNVFSSATRLAVQLPGSSLILLSFLADGRYTVTGAAPSENGTITQTNIDLNTFVFHLTPTSTGSRFDGMVRLDFSGLNSGKIAITESNDGTVSVGTFAYYNNLPPPDWNNLTGLTLFLSNFPPESLTFISSTGVIANSQLLSGSYIYKGAVLELDLFDADQNSFTYRISFNSQSAALYYFVSSPPAP